MRFPILELDIEKYQDDVKHLLEQEECHVFIDTNILAQLFRLNRGARSDFFDWVEDCGTRFHVPNWVVMEYNKYCYGQRLNEYLGDLQIAETTNKFLGQLQKFFCGYVDDGELENTSYEGSVDAFRADMDDVINRYSKLLKAVKSKKSERIALVQKEIEDHLKDVVLDTNIYQIVKNLYYSHQLRLEREIPPGFKDYRNKESNQLGDLIIWNEILNYCHDQHITKAIYITRDSKTDMSYAPACQRIDGHSINSNDCVRIAHESMVYEFQIATGGSEDFYVVSFEMLVKILSDKYRCLAFSFQMVSRDEETVLEEAEGEDMFAPEMEADAEQPQDAEPENGHDENATCHYSDFALADGRYLEHCENDELKHCIERLRSHNWYVQNDAVDGLRTLLAQRWQDNQDNRDAFFVIGRNLLQSADGNSFEAHRFIKDSAAILQHRATFIKHSVIDGYLFEIFFDSEGNVRQKAFKGRYFSKVVEQAQQALGDHAFTFINEKLELVDDRFVPVVGSDEEYTFEFDINAPANDFDDYDTTSLTINGRDASSTFSKPHSSEFSRNNDITRSLSVYYAVPEDKIRIEGVPPELRSLRFIKEEDNDNLFA